MYSFRNFVEESEYLQISLEIFLFSVKCVVAYWATDVDFAKHWNFLLGADHPQNEKRLSRVTSKNERNFYFNETVSLLRRM